MRALVLRLTHRAHISVRVSRRMASRHLMAVTWWGDVETTVVPVPVIMCTCMPSVGMVSGWLHPVSVVEISVVRIVAGEVYLRVVGAASRPRLSAAHVEMMLFCWMEVRGATYTQTNAPCRTI